MKSTIAEILLAGPRGSAPGGAGIDIVRAGAVRLPAARLRAQEIVHNRHVVEELRTKGAIFVDELDEVPDLATVIFSLTDLPRGAARGRATWFCA